MGKFIDEVCKVEVAPVVDAVSLGHPDSYSHLSEEFDDDDIDYEFLRSYRNSAKKLIQVY